jgi:hypothetical protein
MQRYLVLYGESNEMVTFEAEDVAHVTEQFVSWAPISPDPEVNREAINEISLAIPVVKDEVIFEGSQDIKFETVSGDRRWLQMGNIAIYLAHNDEGVSVDLYHHGSEDGESEAGTWLEFNTSD